MKGGDYIALAFIVAVVFAVVVGRRKGKLLASSALAAARAEGRAELAADLAAMSAASAVAHGGSVAVNVGHGSSVGAPDNGTAGYDDDDPRLRSAVQHLGPLHRIQSTHVDGVDRLQHVVQPRPAPIDGHRRALVVGRPGNGRDARNPDQEVT